MSYTKTVWRNNQSPAINADNLNHIEQGIENAHNQMAINASDIETLTTQVQGNASNIASEISARQSGDGNLQSQIDQIIAPSGEAPSAAEVENARIGATSLGSVTYDTLGNAIRGQVTDLNNALNYNAVFDNRNHRANSDNIASLLTDDTAITDNIEVYLDSGSLIAGIPTANNYEVHTDFIDNSATNNPTFYYDSTAYSINVQRFDSNKSYIGQTGWLTIQPIRIRAYLTDPYIRIEMKRNDGEVMDRENVQLYTKRTIANNIAYSSDLNSTENRLLNVASANAKANAKSISDILAGDNVLEEYYPLMERVDYSAGSFVPSTNTLTSEPMVHHIGEKYYYDNTNYKVNICFSSDGTTYSATGFTALASPFTLEPYGISATYVRIAVRKTSESTIEYITEGDVHSSYTAQNNISYTTSNSHSISNGDSLLEGVQYCYANGKGKLIVEAGTYDVIAEYELKYGATYFSNYADNYNGMVNGHFDCGIWLENIEVVFSSGAKVVANYEGNNSYVKTFFSAFACGNNVTIDGLVLDASELRYGIHPDFNTGDALTTFIVKNSDLHHYKPSSQSNNNQCLGCGLGKHVRWIFENDIFRSDGNNIVVRIHNNVNSDAQSQIIMKNCYFDGDGYARFNAYSTSELQTMIEVCGCSYKTAPVVGRETSGSNDNFTLIAWNNELRS